MVVVYNQSSEDVWVVNRSLSQGSWIAVHDAIPKGYSYVTVAYNVSVQMWLVYTCVAVTGRK